MVEADQTAADRAGGWWQMLRDDHRHGQGCSDIARAVLCLGGDRAGCFRTSRSRATADRNATRSLRKPPRGRFAQPADHRRCAATGLVLLDHCPQSSERKSEPQRRGSARDAGACRDRSEPWHSAVRSSDIRAGRGLPKLESAWASLVQAAHFGMSLGSGFDPVASNCAK